MRIAQPVMLPKKLIELFNSDKMILSAYGGRGSGKSEGFATFCLRFAMSKKTRVLCVRQIQNSIRDSVHNLLIRIIERHGWQRYFKWTDTTLKCVNGTDFVFKGTQRNIREIKSLDNIGLCWLEEAEGTPEETMDILLPTLRADDVRVLIGFNPENEDSYIYNRFGLNPLEDTEVVKINYTDNPHFPKSLQIQMEACKKNDPEKYDHVWLGYPKKYAHSLIFRGKYESYHFDTPSIEDIKYNRFFYGGDFGFKHPTVLTRSFILDNTLYIDYEAYESEVSIEKLPALFDKVPDSKRWRITADSSRPDLIQYISRKGFSIIGCQKNFKRARDSDIRKAGQGKEPINYIEAGLTYLKSFDKIVIHPRCENTLFEFKNYSYKIDEKDGTILPIIVDKHNHAIDSLRYAHETYMRAKPTLQQIMNN